MHSLSGLSRAREGATRHRTFMIHARSAQLANEARVAEPRGRAEAILTVLEDRGVEEVLQPTEIGHERTGALGHTGNPLQVIERQGDKSPP